MFVEEIGFGVASWRRRGSIRRQRRYFDSGKVSVDLAIHVAGGDSLQGPDAVDWSELEAAQLGLIEVLTFHRGILK